MDKYFQILDKYCSVFNIPAEEKDVVEEKLANIFDSQSWRNLRHKDQMRIVPQTLSSESLRVFKKAENIQKTTVHDKFRTIDYNYEKNAHLGLEDDALQQNVDFSLCYVKPEYRSRYTLIAQMLYILEVELKIFNRRVDIVNNDENEYDKILTGITQGLNRHYKLDDLHENQQELYKSLNPDTIDYIMLEKCLVYMDYLDRSMVEMEYYKNKKFEKQDLYEKISNEIDAKLQMLKPEERDKAMLDFRTKINLLRQENQALNRLEVLTEGKIKVLWDLIKDINIIYSLEDKLISMGMKVKIPKRRYYINVYKEHIEKNIFKEGYLQNIEGKPSLLETDYKTKYKLLQNLTNEQQQWYRRPDFWVNNLREIEGQEKRDGTVVDKLKLPNEEKIKSVFRSTIQSAPSFLKLDM